MFKKIRQLNSFENNKTKLFNLNIKLSINLFF